MNEVDYYYDGYEQGYHEGWCTATQKVVEWLYNRQTVDLEVPNMEKFINDLKQHMEQ